MHHHTTHTSPTELHAQITADAAKATAQARKGGPMRRCPRATSTTAEATGCKLWCS